MQQVQFGKTAYLDGRSDSGPETLRRDLVGDFVGRLYILVDDHHMSAIRSEALADRGSDAAAAACARSSRQSNKGSNSWLADASQLASR